MSATAPRAALLAAAPLDGHASMQASAGTAGADATPIAIATPAAPPASADTNLETAAGDGAEAGQAAPRPRPQAADTAVDAPVAAPAQTAATAFGAEAVHADAQLAADDGAAAAASPTAHAIALTSIGQAVPADAVASHVTPAASARPATTAQVGTPAPLPQSPANAGSIGGALFALVLVVGLILGLAWLAKRMPGLGGARGNPALRVVGSLALGPRERVVVVAVGETQLLLGVGPGGTRTLHTLDAPLPVPAEARATPAFAQLLAQHFGKKA